MNKTHKLDQKLLLTVIVSNNPATRSHSTNPAHRYSATVTLTPSKTGTSAFWSCITCSHPDRESIVSLWRWSDFWPTAESPAYCPGLDSWLLHHMWPNSPPMKIPASGSFVVKHIVPDRFGQRFGAFESAYGVSHRAWFDFLRRHSLSRYTSNRLDES